MRKTNRKIYKIAIILTLLTVFFGCNKKDDTKIQGVNDKKEVSIDVSRSTINWTAYKKNGKHTGTLNFLNGSFNLEGGFPVSGNCIVDLNSIKINDIQDSAENKKVIDYLKSKNFLDVEKYPQAIVNIRTILPLRLDRMPNVNTTIKGSITLKDSTLAMVVTALTSYYRDSIVSKANITLNGANWNLPLKSINIDKDYKENPYKDDYDLELYVVAK